MGFAHAQTLATEALLQKVSAELNEAVGFQKGIWMERKPVAVSVHTRPAAAGRCRRRDRRPPGRSPRRHGLAFIVDGSVLDLSILEPAKADALENLRSRLGASAAMFAGDADSDELAMATLRGPDMGLRVGAGEVRGRAPAPGPGILCPGPGHPL